MQGLKVRFKKSADFTPQILLSSVNLLATMFSSLAGFVPKLHLSSVDFAAQELLVFETTDEY